MNKVKGIGADKLLWQIAHNALMRWTGIAINASGIKNKDEVRGLLGQCTEVALTSAQCLLCQYALSNVSCHTNQASNLSIYITQRCELCLKDYVAYMVNRRQCFTSQSTAYMLECLWKIMIQ